MVSSYYIDILIIRPKKFIWRRLSLRQYVHWIKISAKTWSRACVKEATPVFQWRWECNKPSPNLVASNEINTYCFSSQIGPWDGPRYWEGCSENLCTTLGDCTQWTLDFSSPTAHLAKRELVSLRGTGQWRRLSKATALNEHICLFFAFIRKHTYKHHTQRRRRYNHRRMDWSFQFQSQMVFFHLPRGCYSPNLQFQKVKINM